MLAAILPIYAPVPKPAACVFALRLIRATARLPGVSLNVRLLLVTKCNGYFSRGDYYLGVIKQEQVNERLV